MVPPRTAHDLLDAGQMLAGFGQLYPVVYDSQVTEVRRTPEFDKWLSRLRDGEARARILTRIVRLSLGHPGDVRSVGDGVSEMRIPYGPGYRVHYTQIGELIVVLLIGGDKSTQDGDIAKAKSLAAGL